MPRFAVKHHEFNFPDRRLPWPPVDSQGGETENAFHWIDVNQDFEFLPEYWKDMNRNFAKRHGRAEKLNEEPEIGTQETLRAFHWIDVNQPVRTLLQLYYLESCRYSLHSYITPLLKYH